MPALAAKSGSRGKIHDRCRQGLIASAASQRATVDAEMSSTMPAQTASSARSAALHRDSGTPWVAGSSQARALTCAVCTAVNRRGRPGRGASASPSSRRRQNRARHFRTVSTCTPWSAAIAVLAAPSAAANTIRARSAIRACAVGRANATNAACSSPVSTIWYGLDGDIGIVLPDHGSRRRRDTPALMGHHQMLCPSRHPSRPRPACANG
jgi:hypothetical protein